MLQHDEFIIFIKETFDEYEKKQKDGHILLTSSVCLKTLVNLYERAILDNDEFIRPIESLTIEEKTKFWDIGKKYYTAQGQAIKAAKSAYILSLL